MTDNLSGGNQYGRCHDCGGMTAYPARLPKYTTTLRGRDGTRYEVTLDDFPVMVCRECHAQSIYGDEATARLDEAFAMAESSRGQP